MEEENKTIDVNFKKMKTPIIFAIVIIVIIVAVLGVAQSGFYTLENGQAGVVLRFGTVTKVEETAGIHFKVPIVEEVRKVHTSNVYKMEYGFRTAQDSTATAEAAYENNDSEALVIVEANANNASIALIDVIIQYKISDPVNYLFKVDDVEGTIRLALEDTIRKTMQTFTLDEARTQKELIDQKVQSLLAEKLDKYDVGIEIITAKTQNVELLPNVQEAYRQKENANQYKNGKQEESEKYKNSVIPIANADAIKLVEEANGYKAERLANARAAVAEFNALYSEYLVNPEILREKYYIESMTNFIKNNKIVIDASANGDIYKFYNFDENNIVKENLMN